MTYYDHIYEFAVDNYYLISSRDAAGIGVPGIELAKLAHRGKLKNLSRGLYRLTRYVPTEFDAYAIAVARVDDEAFLYGESVIALLGLGPTNPAYICVATSKRVRKNLPDNIRVVKATGNRTTLYEGIRCQRVKDAIASCKATMMDERLRQVAKYAQEKGYLTKREATTLAAEMGWQ